MTGHMEERGSDPCPPVACQKGREKGRLDVQSLAEDEGAGTYGAGVLVGSISTVRGSVAEQLLLDAVTVATRQLPCLTDRLIRRQEGDRETRL